MEGADWPILEVIISWLPASKIGMTLKALLETFFGLSLNCIVGDGGFYSFLSLKNSHSMAFGNYNSIRGTPRQEKSTRLLG